MTTVHYLGTLSDPARRKSLGLHLTACAKSTDWGSMPDLAVTDESEYWDHGDEAELKAYFARLDRLAKNFCDHLTNDVATSPDAGSDNLVDCITLAAEMTHRQERQTEGS